MEKMSRQEGVLIGIALVLCAVLIGYSAMAGSAAKPAEIVYVASSAVEEDGTAKVSINNASLEQLCELPGIGEVTAGKIIDYRKEHGGFRSLEELKNVERIGDKTFEKLLPYITL